MLLFYPYNVLDYVLQSYCIDISWVDCPYTVSTCDVMYCPQRLHYGGEKLKYYLTPSPEVLSLCEDSADNPFKWDTVCI
jgi:hypothetical protein